MIARAKNHFTSFLVMLHCMKRVPKVRSLKLLGWHALALSLAASVVAHAPAAAGSLSDQLAEKIVKAREAEQKRNFGIALSNYNEALQTEGVNVDETRVLLKNRSAFFERVEMYDRAEADLSNLVKVKPSDPSVYADRGYFYIRRSRFGDALDDFLNGAKLDPRSPLYHFGAGRALAGSENYDGALTFYNEALKRGPDDAKLYLARAEALVNLRRWDEARANYDRALALGMTKTHDKYFAIAGRGYVSLVLTEYDIAIEFFNRALDVNPSAWNVVMWRGYAYERRGYTAAALRDYAQAEQLRPDETMIRNSISRVRATLK
jgi:tetratricopeptide (TPR) repeat protein